MRLVTRTTDDVRPSRCRRSVAPGSIRVEELVRARARVSCCVLVCAVRVVHALSECCVWLVVVRVCACVPYYVRVRACALRAPTPSEPSPLVGARKHTRSASLYVCEQATRAGNTRARAPLSRVSRAILSRARAPAPHHAPHYSSTWTHSLTHHRLSFGGSCLGPKLWKIAIYL